MGRETRENRECRRIVERYQKDMGSPRPFMKLMGGLK
jgi:hypothetical protein